MTLPPPDAAGALRRAVAAAPGDVPALEALAMRLIERGEPAQALPHLRRAVALQPHSLPLLNNLGGLLESLQRADEALDCYQRAVALAPDEAVPQVNLGQALCGARRFDEALTALRTAATLQPGLAPAWSALGRCLQQAGSPRAALAALRQAVALDDTDDLAWQALGESLHALGRPAEALPCYEAALRHRSQGAAAQAGSAQAVAEQRSRDAALWYGLGRARAADGQALAAASALGRCLELDAGHLAALHEQARSLFELGCVEQAVRMLRQVAARGQGAVRQMALENLAVMLPGSPADDNASILALRQAYARGLSAAWPPTPAPPPPPRAAAGCGPLRVGYLSSFFHRPNWMKPVWALVVAHDRARVQVELVVDGPVDGLRQAYRLHPGDGVHGVQGLDNAEVARRIAALGLDLLVDLNGYSVPSRLPVFLQRPAPRQVGWFNYYATSGLDCFDALVGDAHVSPPAEDHFCSEPVLRLPGSYLAFQVDHPAPDVLPPPVLAGSALTFGSLASMYKITDAVVHTWAGILQACPGTRLLLRNGMLGRPEHQDHLAARFAACGVARERLLLLGPAPHAEFLATYGAIDVALDPFPYSGGTTTMEALWQGVPVLSCDAGRWASRTSISLLRAAGLDDFIVREPTDCIDWCRALAADAGTPARLAALRAGLRERLRASPVCDGPALARGMEQIYEQLART